MLLSLFRTKTSIGWLCALVTGNPVIALQRLRRANIAWDQPIHTTRLWTMAVDVEHVRCRPVDRVKFFYER